MGDWLSCCATLMRRVQRTSTAGMSTLGIILLISIRPVRMRKAQAQHPFLPCR
jgi:hypothetical protein